MKKKKIIASSLLGLSILAAGMTLSSCDMELAPTYDAGQTTTTTQPKPTTTPTVQKVTVSFNANGGTAVTAQSINKGAKATKPANPTKAATTKDGVTTSYAFAGWFTDAQLTKAFDFNTAVNANITLYAKWTDTATYTITFNSNGGTAVTQQKVVKGNKVTKPANPTMASTAQKSFEFAGWYSDQQLTKAYDFNAQVTGNLTLYAKWTETVAKYDVTWKNGTTILKTEKVEYGKIPVYTGATPTKPKTAEYTYVFIGWTPEISQVTGAVTYNATFTQYKNEYEVKFVNRGNVVASSYLEYGQVPTINYQPTDYQDAQYDHEFIGWSPEVSAVTGTITYTATYRDTLREYTVTFVDDQYNPLYSHIYKYGETPEYQGEQPAKTPTREKQYTFDGWDNQVVAVTGDATYVAKFKVSAREYNVEWYTEYVSATENTKFADTTWTYGTDVAEPTSVPTCEDSDDGQYSYTFDEWLPLGLDDTTGIVRYVASFNEQVNQYTYRFVNGETEVVKNTVDWGTVIPNPGDLVKQDTDQYKYTFNGWYTKDGTGNDWGTKVDFTVDNEITQNVTYYARFDETLQKYDVKFMVNGVQYGTTQNLDYGSIIEEPIDDPEIPETAQYYYVFDGWYTKDGTGNDWGEEVDFILSDITVTGNVTYYAKFIQSTQVYDIVFMNGEDEFESFELDYGTQIVKPTDNPSKDATDTKRYEFDDWYTNDGTAGDWGTKVTAYPTVTGDVTYYAKFDEINILTVTFDSKGGTAVTSAKVDEGATATAPTAPTKETTEVAGVTTEYEFAGWYTSTDGGTTLSNTAYDFTTPVNAALTLYAKWNESYKYEVTFDSMGGTAVDSVKVDADTKTTAPTAPTKETTTVDGTITSFAFDSWCIRTGEGTQASPYVYTPFNFANTNITGVMTLYAKWTESYKYVVTFVFDDESTTTVEVAKDATITTIPELPVKVGYTSVGWCTRSGDAPNYVYTPFGASTAITAPLTLYARYTINEYTVNFISDGAAYGTAQNVEYNKKATAPATAPTKDYYDFKFWATRSGDAPNYTYTQYNFDTAVTADLTLYAVFTAHEYTITYTLDGGTNHADNPAKYTVESDAITLKEPTKTGFEFAGWTYGDVTIPVKEVTIAQGYHEDITFVAHWLEEYTITYNDVEGATFVTENPTKYTIKTPTFTLNNPSKDGYTFVGWTYTGQTTPTTTVEITIGSEGNKVFTAVWSVEVTFDAMGATQNIPQAQTIVIKAGAVVTKPADPAKYGFTFEGWYLSSDDGTTLTTEYDFTTAVTAPVKLYAKWQLETKYTVTFNTGEGGSSVTDQIVVSGKTVSEPLDPTNTDTDKSFLGWFTASGTAPDIVYTEYNFNTPVTADLVLYAQWITSNRTVNLYVDGDVVQTIENQKYGQKISVQVADPIKAGHTFQGWFVDASLTIPFNVTYDVINNETEIFNLYAKFKVNKYNVLFDTNGGSNVSGTKVEYGKTVNRPANPTKANYIFVGWYDQALENKFDFAQAITGPTTIYAKWQEESRTVGTEAEFLAALQDNVATVVLSNDIALTNPVRLDKDVTIDGKIDDDHNYKLTIAEDDYIKVDEGVNAVLKNVDIEAVGYGLIISGNLTYSGGSITGEYGLSVQTDKSIIEISNAKITGFGGIVIMKSNCVVNIKDSTITGKNTYNGDNNYGAIVLCGCNNTLVSLKNTKVETIATGTASEVAVTFVRYGADNCYKNTVIFDEACTFDLADDLMKFSDNSLYDTDTTNDNRIEVGNAVVNPVDSYISWESNQQMIRVNSTLEQALRGYGHAVFEDGDTGTLTKNVVLTGNITNTAITNSTITLNLGEFTITGGKILLPVGNTIKSDSAALGDVLVAPEGYLIVSSENSSVYTYSLVKCLTNVTFGSSGNYTTIEDFTYTSWNRDNGGNECQFGNLAGEISFYVNDGAVVTISSHNGYTHYTIEADGVTSLEQTGTSYSMVVGNASKVIIKSTTTDNYLYSISVTYPTFIDEDTTIQFGSEGNYKDIEGLVYTSVSNGDHGTNDSQLGYTGEGKEISFYVNAGAEISIASYNGYTHYTIEADGVTSLEQTGTSYSIVTGHATKVVIKSTDSDNYFYSIRIKYISFVEENVNMLIGTNNTELSKKLGTSEIHNAVDFNGFTFDGTAGKIHVYSGTNGQFNKDAKVTFYVLAGAIVNVKTYSNAEVVSINGEATFSKTFATNTKVTILMTDNGYLENISVTYPAVVDKNTTITFGDNSNIDSIKGVSYTTAMRANGNNTQVTGGSITISALAGATVTIYGYGGSTGTKNGDHTNYTVTANNSTSENQTGDYSVTLVADGDVVITPSNNDNYFMSIKIEY